MNGHISGNCERVPGEKELQQGVDSVYGGGAAEYIGKAITEFNRV